jgi:hypothetical protein
MTRLPNQYQASLKEKKYIEGIAVIISCGKLPAMNFCGVLPLRFTGTALFLYIYINCVANHWLDFSAVYVKNKPLKEKKIFLGKFKYKFHNDNLRPRSRDKKNSAFYVFMQPTIFLATRNIYVTRCCIHLGIRANCRKNAAQPVSRHTYLLYSRFGPTTLYVHRLTTRSACPPGLAGSRL